MRYWDGSFIRAARGNVDDGGIFNLRAQHIYKSADKWAPSVLVTSGLVVNLDAGNSTSYPGSGTTWTDLSGNGNNGTLVNSTGYSSADGGALVFDGTNDYVNLGAVQVNTASGTIGFWVNLDSNGGRFFGRHGNFEVRFDVSNQLALDFGASTSLTSSRTSWTGAWLYVVITWSQSSNTSSLYVNNVLDNTGSCNTVSSLTGDMHIGRSSASAQYIDGKLSVFHSYNRILTAAELTQNYNTLKGRYGL